MTRRAAKHTRTVSIDELGDVTVEGLPTERLAQRYPERAGEPRLDLILAEADAAGRQQVPPAVYRHPVFTRQIAGQVVEPPLSVGRVELLSVDTRRQLLRAIMDAHPETRRLQRDAERASR